MNKSEQIRRLHDEGYKIQEIADKLGIRYQFAYNVVTHYEKSTAKRLIAAAKDEESGVNVPVPSSEFSLWRWIVGRA